MASGASQASALLGIASKGGKILGQSAPVVGSIVSVAILGVDLRLGNYDDSSLIDMFNQMYGEGAVFGSKEEAEAAVAAARAAVEDQKKSGAAVDAAHSN